MLPGLLELGSFAGQANGIVFCKSSRVVAPDFRQLFEAAPALYTVLDREFHIVAASDAYLSATMTRRGEVIGRSVFEVFPAGPGGPGGGGAGGVRGGVGRAVGG